MRQSSVTTFIKRGKEILEPSAEDLNDRIINLKFIRANGDFFTIRSDYEIVYLRDGTYYFKRCTDKPNISIRFNQVASTTAISVSINIGGFSISRETVSSRMDASDENPIERCIVQLGYRAQFPDWTEASRMDKKEEFYDLNNNGITSDAEVARGRQLVVQILDNYRSSAPPANGWTFEGAISTLDDGLAWNHTEEALNDKYTYGVDGFPDGLSQFEAVVYQWITRRFIRSSIDHLSTGKALAVKGYKKYMDPAADDNRYTALELDSDGLMKIRDADMFGVPCVCSPTLSKLAVKTLYTFSGTDEGKTFEEPDTLYADAQTTLGAQLVSLQNHYPFLRWYKLANGGFYMYHMNETEEDLFKSPAFIANKRNGVYTIPAIYSMSIGGMRTIRMPFTGFIDPLTTVRFNARYAAGSLVGYFYPIEKGTEYFTVILSSVSFSTVGTGEDANVMELSCIDAPAAKVEEDVVVEVEDEDLFTFTSYIDRKKKEAAEKVKEVSYTIGAKPYDGVAMSWTDVASLFVLSAKTDQWDEGEPTLQQALDSLKKWNTALWNGNLSSADGDAPENGLGTFTSKIPWLYVGDVVKYHIPYRPSDA